MKKLVALASLLIITSLIAEEEKEFIHNQAGNLPWTNTNFDNSQDKFMFAIFSDLNGGEREKVFEVAVEQLLLLRPEFIISVGDLIDDTKYKSSTEQRWESFNSRASKINAPIFYVGGNNDLSNNVMKKSWKDKYGPTYYHFIYKNILFLVLDTEDYAKKSSNLFSYTMDAQISGDIGIPQKDYFLEVIKNNQDVDWTFLFMHKPIWLKEEEPEFFAIEAALTKRPYTLFNGHLHTYSYNKRKERDYIMLGTTGGRQRTKEKNSFDHVTLVTVDKNGPSIVNLKLEGILDKKGEIPIQGKELCFHAYSCN